MIEDEHVVSGPMRSEVWRVGSSSSAMTYAVCSIPSAA
jgi:hypothetical protein